LRIGGVRPVQVDRADEGTRDRRLQAREFFLDRRAVLRADFITQFFEHGSHAAHDLDRHAAVFTDFGHAERQVVLPAAGRDYQAGADRVTGVPS